MGLWVPRRRLLTLGGGGVSYLYSATYTQTAQPSNSETVTVGSTVYTWKTSPSATYDVAIGASEVSAVANLVTSINNGASKHPDAVATDNGDGSMVLQGNSNNVLSDTAANGSWNKSQLDGSLAYTYSTYVLSSTHQITAPATVDDGDILLLSDRCDRGFQGSDPGVVTPSGFSLIASAYAKSSGFWPMRHSLFAKLCTSSDASVTFTGMQDQAPAANAHDNKILVLLKKDQGDVDTMNVQDSYATVVDGDPTDTTVNCSNSTKSVVIAVSGHGTDHSSMASNSLAGSSSIGPQEIGNYNNNVLRWRIFNPQHTKIDIAAATGDANINNSLMSGYLELYAA